MGKKDENPKPAYSVNLETLIAEVGIKKNVLADKIHTSPQTISKACNGVRLTQSMAQSIIDEYPQYNLGWLLGYSTIKFKSDADKAFLRQAELHQKARKHKETFFDTVARLAEDVGFETYFNGSVLQVEPSKELLEGGFEPVVLTYKNNELQYLQEDIVAFIKYRFEVLIKRGQDHKEGE